ncbi:hypothetical protein AHF37_11640 [Paragonimus kellicotti]|nr:hypothetical protein AHF37_11640 [Paragonimus kellicotti]
MAAVIVGFELIGIALIRDKPSLNKPLQDNGPSTDANEVSNSFFMSELYQSCPM